MQLQLLLEDWLSESIRLSRPAAGGDNLLALAYRCAYAVIGGYVAAGLAPRAPVGHALAFGGIDVVLTTLGALAAWKMSPAWFLIALIALSLPVAWSGLRLQARGAK